MRPNAGLHLRAVGLPKFVLMNKQLPFWMHLVGKALLWLHTPSPVLASRCSEGLSLLLHTPQGWSLTSLLLQMSWQEVNGLLAGSPSSPSTERQPGPTAASFV